MIKAHNTELPKGSSENVIKASIRERLMFKEFRNRQNDFKIKHISFVEEADSWDVIYLSGQTEYLAEIKTRDKKFQDWDQEGWILEEYKYNALCELQKKSKRPLKKTYVNIFKDAVVIWDLDSIELQFIDRECKVMTVENKGKRNKKVALLKSEQGTVYKGNYDISMFTWLSEKIFEFFYPESDK